MRGILKIALFIFVGACTQQKTPAAGATPAANKTTLASSNTGSASNAVISNVSTQEQALAPIDPTTASASIAPVVTLYPSDILTDQNIVFPSLAVTKVTADFIELIRCAASYEMQTLAGESLRNSSTNFSYTDREYAWSEALGDNHNCKIVAEYVSSPTYSDIAASSGSFYYIANPCVTAARSTTGQEACSYNFSFSNTVLNYDNTFMDSLSTQATQLAQDQCVLTAATDQVGLLAKELELAIAACQEYFAWNENNKAIWSGLIMLGANLAGAAVGGVVMGATGAIMAGMMAQQFGIMIIDKYVINLAPGMNTCLSGTAGVNTEVAQGAIKGSSNISQANASAQSYQSKFNVVQIMKQLNALVQPATQADSSTSPPTQASPGGAIAQAITRVQQDMTAMSALNAQIISGDNAIAQGNAYAASQVAKLPPALVNSATESSTSSATSSPSP